LKRRLSLERLHHVDVDVDKMFEISNLTKRNLPLSKLRFALMKEEILGKKFELSLVFAGKARMKNLNKKHRNKDYSANVLSFPLSEKSGEIFINLDIKTEAKKFDMSYTEYISLLFIHGCLHLKGYDHGEEMEKMEDRYLNKLK
jgi:probable rRNA maturation factor